jgi:flagellum-specific peptidoglycan hydrolase FlgJ
MKPKDQKTILYVALGGVGLYLLSKSQSSAPASSSDSSSSGPLDFLSTVTSGITDTIGMATGSLQSNFVATMTPIAQAIQAQWGIDPLITITQAALESAWGASGLTKKANNLYGYTGDAALNTWLSSHGLASNTPMDQIQAMDLSAAPFIILQTHEEVSADPITFFVRPNDVVSQSGTDAIILRPFRRYDSWASSVNDWVQLLRNKRYAAAWQDALAGDLQSFANDIYAGGYATESDYPTQIVSVGDEVSGIQTA